MADRSGPLGSETRTDGASTDTPPKLPRWVKVSGIVLGVVILVVVILMLAGVAGQHGPGRHLRGGDAPPTQVSAGHTPPAEGHG